MDSSLKDFDANGLYPTSMADSESIYLKIENDYAFTKDMINDLPNALNNQKFTKSSANRSIKNYNPKHTIVQYLPVNQKVGNAKNFKMRNR